MVATESSMMVLGSPAADFSLPDVTRAGAFASVKEYAGRPMLVMFICNHCPYVIHVMDVLTQIANGFQEQGFAVVAISANDVENYPQDGPEKMAEFAAQYGFNFPYCYDETQATAKAYDAQCTPDFFVYDAEHRLAYRGQMDGARPGNQEPVTGIELSTAMTAILRGQPVSSDQKPSLGCNIKWKPDG